jgi:queuine tRNA-ribosyltransferase
MNELLSILKSIDGPSPLIFAPVLPVERPIQWQYLDHLAEGVVNSLSGLAFYDVDLIPELSHYESLQTLPRLLLQPPTSPRQVLRQVSLGADLIIAPFINASSDAGVAFSFEFPPAVPGPSSELLPLGIDMWTAEHSASLEPLMPGCSCYACSRHHRAFVQHLLNVKEMLGWTLLQIHNHHVVSEFFRGVRETLEKGTEVFEDAVNAFGRAYEAEFPPGTGQRPRARGYHFKSEGGDLPLNQKAWSKDVQAGIAGEGSPTEGVEAVEAEMESMRV